MSARSETLAFSPTPAVEFNQNSFLNFSDIHHYRSMDDIPEDRRNVHFSASTSKIPTKGRHSIATSNVPLLPPVPSASQIPKQSFQITNLSQNVDVTAYFEQCRNVNEQLRRAHEQERKAWEIERMAMKTRIADLEFRLNRSTGKSKRRSSIESSHASTRPFDRNLQIPTMHRLRNATSPAVRSEPGQPPVWEPAASPATRVFSHDDDVSHLPSITEDGTASMSRQRTRDHHSVSISELDPSLDGVTLRAEAVKSSFERLLSPVLVASPDRQSPSQSQFLREPPLLQLPETNGMLDPSDAKRLRHAGHTPLAFDGALSSAATTEQPTPKDEIVEQDENPIAPAPTARPPKRPSERSNSYFGDVNVTSKAPEEEGVPLDEVEKLHEEQAQEHETRHDTEEDPALRMPLMLDPIGKSEAAHSFLDRLDDKLADVVRQSQQASPERSPQRQRNGQNEGNAGTDEEDGKSSGMEEEMPKLRLKKSTNFGSAYGFKMPGRFERQ